MNVDISNYMLYDQKVIFETIKIFQNWHMVINTQTTVRNCIFVSLFNQFCLQSINKKEACTGVA